MKKILLLISCAIVLFGCKKEKEENSQIPFLREKFQGKYRILSSYSSIPVDLNNDGVESTNLLTENSLILFDAKLICRIPTGYDSDKVFLLDEIWPTETDRRPEITEVIPIYGVPTETGAYNPYITLINATFTDDFKSASATIFFPGMYGKTLIDIYFEFLEDEIIKTTATRKLYTRTGWVTVEIESVYRRYTEVL
ncbi:hypothetical protein [Alkaliflexus imshenetskii]|uniref:hypothetical protein n=1 Tax=Alkaliflexus imshenetskii TaxID=286730 RepID=UPI00047DDFFB|nr:hypothetical protein [Alkaliflexus imshenetskii]